MFVVIALLFSLSASAGSLSFQLSLTGAELTLINRGDASAFYPAVFLMRADGGWGRLAATSAPAELPAGAGMRFTWADMRPPERISELERMRPVLVRFFDQSGVGFGQITFFQTPPPVKVPLKAQYSNSFLQIEAPDEASSARATWVLWPEEQGIGPIRAPVRFEHSPPPARRVDWRSQGRVPFRLDTGAGQPAVILIHETAQGYAIQSVPSGGLQGREQRAAWLDGTAKFYLGSLIALAIAAGAMVLRYLRRPRPRERVTASAHLPGWLADGLFILASGLLIANTLGISFLNSPNWPTGGDSASHLLYAWLYSDSLLFSGKILPWLPEVFGGLPFLSYYFPLPFILIGLLSKLLGIALAFKWGSFLAAMLLPGAVFVASRRWLGMSWVAALFGAAGALAFLLHEQNSIWGGNLLSTLAGEFAYGYGLCFAILTMIAWLRAVHTGRGWIVAALLEAATGFSHGFPLLLVGFSTVFLLFEGANFRRTLTLLARGHLLAFCLLGGWLWPMLEMHGLTIPNDAAFPVQGWRDLFPAALWPVAATGLAGLAMQLVPAARRRWTSLQTITMRYFASSAGLAALAFLAGDQLGLADIRFFPLVWLLGAIVCGWLFGESLATIGDIGQGQPKLNIARSLFAAAAVLGLLGWVGQQVRAAPDWALWNHAGLDSKPQWHNLTGLFPAMSGNLWSPRLVFEHDPANHDIGSTRVLEALPMFLNHRPVLEGLYMETAVLGPPIYQLQSEISARPSSPLVRFPSGSLDPQFAARHMNFLHADSLLLRSAEAQSAIESSRLFDKIAAAPPFALYRLRGFDSQLIELVRQPLLVRPLKDWMQDAFAWFRTRSRFDSYLPVFGELPMSQLVVPQPGAGVRAISLSRHELVFETDAVGSAHLIKIAYHPRWQLRTQGAMTAAGPGYMLVVPQEQQIRLVYGHTLVGKLGMAATLFAALYLFYFAWRRRWRAVVAAAPASASQRWRPAFIVAWLGLLAAGFYFGTRSPERIYNLAWEAMRANRHVEASAEFARAYALRRPPAKKEEALFWLAKSSELAGRRTEAKARYLELAQRYHGYWLPESLYTYVLLERQEGHSDRAAPFATRLREEYPGNKWTLKLDEAK